MYTKFVSEQTSQRECPSKVGINGSGNNNCPNKVDSNDNGINKCPIMSKMVDSLQKERQENGVKQNEKQNSDKTQPTSNKCSKCSDCCKGSPNKPPPVRSASGNYLSQDGSPGSIPGRKTSNISNVSSSGGSDETDGEKKLDLRSLIESIGTLLIPVVSVFLFRLNHFFF